METFKIVDEFDPKEKPMCLLIAKEICDLAQKNATKVESSNIRNYVVITGLLEKVLGRLTTCLRLVEASEALNRRLDERVNKSKL